MTLVTTRPNSTVIADSTPTGAATIHGALSDDSDSSYVTGGAGVFTIGCADPVIPAGAVVKDLALRVRAARPGGGSGLITFSANAPDSDPNFVVAQTTITVTWTSPTTITIGRGATSVASDISVTGGLYDQPNLDARIYEVFADTTYVARPVVNATGPASPVTDTNRPTVAWTRTLDADGGPQTRFQVKVFTDAQYGAGGFDPDTSSPAANSGQVSSATLLWQVAGTLPDDTYRAYVRVAQTVNGELHWSDWDYQQFDLTVALPAVPLMTLTAEDAEGRIRIDLDDQPGDATTSMFEVERSTDGGATWDAPRMLRSDGLLLPSGGNATTYDYEAPNGAATMYRARALHNYSGVYAASAWVTDSETWSSSDGWLKNAIDPALNVAVEVVSYADRKRAARQGVIQPLGATVPVVVSDTRAAPTGTIVVATTTQDGRDAVDAIIDTGQPILLQVQASSGEPDRWVIIGDHDRVRGIDKAFSITRNDTLPWVQVARPVGEIVAWPEDGS